MNIRIISILSSGGRTAVRWLDENNQCRVREFDGILTERAALDLISTKATPPDAAGKRSGK